MTESDSDIFYCINQVCADRKNIGSNLSICSSCGGRLLVGERYRLIKRIDKHLREGYIAKWVFEAEDTQSGERVILKIVDFTRPDWIKYLKREHEFLLLAPPPFYKVTEEDYFIWNPSLSNSSFQVHCLVIPKLEGEDTESWVQKNGPIDELTCLEWLFELLPYLEAFSKFPAIYRDLTPANIMASPDGLQLVDFGSVKVIDNEYLSILESNLPNAEGNDIRRGTRIFTPAYAPREQLFGQSVPQSDFFALGRTIIYWVTGISPIDLWQDGEIDLGKYRPDLSKTFIHFVEWLTKEEAGARPSSAENIKYYLEESYVFLIEAEENKNNIDDLIKSYRRKLYKKSVILSLLATSAFAVVGWFGISQFWYRQGLKSIDSSEYKRAAQELTQAYNINPFFRDALVEKGFACIGHNDYECAESVYQKLLQDDPENSLYLYQLGFVLEEMDRIEEARNYYQSSIQAQPIQIESQLRLARLAMESDDLGVAAENLMQVENNINSYPDRVQPSDRGLLNYYQGWLQLKKGDNKSAKKYLDAALDIMPSNSKVSVADGDILCLLAFTNTEIKADLNTQLGTWNGCFMSPTRTEEGTAIRDQKIQSVLKNSLE